MGRIYLSERTRTFKTHQTLSEHPTTFTAAHATGAIFYLPKEQGLGGDAFIVAADQTLTVSLLGDVKGDGRVARNRIEPLIPDLEQLVTHTTGHPFNDQEVLSDIGRLDRKAGYHSMFALSLLRIEPDGTTYILNEGENLALIRKQGVVQDLSEQLSHGKIGILSLTLRGREVQDAIRPYKEQLHLGDRVLLCTDGVYEFGGEGPDKEQAIAEISHLFKTANTPRNAVALINKHIREKVLAMGTDNPEDDYTIVCMELK